MLWVVWLWISVSYGFGVVSIYGDGFGCCLDLDTSDWDFVIERFLFMGGLRMRCSNWMLVNWEHYLFWFAYVVFSSKWGTLLGVGCFWNCVNVCVVCLGLLCLTCWGCWLLYLPFRWFDLLVDLVGWVVFWVLSFCLLRGFYDTYALIYVCVDTWLGSF